MLIFLFTGNNPILYCQNMVLNHSFEEYLPPEPDENNDGLEKQTIKRAINWDELGGTADIYIVGGGGMTTRPESPRTGNVHAGIVVVGGNSNSNYREFLVGKTMPLVAGTLYYIEFYAKRTNGSIDIEMGMNLSKMKLTNAFEHSGQIVFPQIFSVIPSSSNNYVKIIGCWTAPENGVYYLTIGSFVPTEKDGNELSYFFIDDVSITANTSLPNPSFDLVIGAAFCPNSQILISTDNNQNIQVYKYEIFVYNNSTSNFEKIKTSNWYEGVPIQRDLRTVNGGPFAVGRCYKVNLIARNGCTETVKSRNFCIEDPSSIIQGSELVCQGSSPIYTAVSASGNTFQWSTGSMSNTTQLSNIALATTISVVTTTPSGCTNSTSKNIDIHRNPNLAPTLSINGMPPGSTHYVNANDAICLNIQSHDDNNEKTYVQNLTQLVNSSFQTNNNFHQGGQFCWNTNDANVGVNTIQFKVSDNNVCGNITSIYTFYIKVLCQCCPKVIYYENNRPNNNPLPKLTEAGQSVIAGKDVDPLQLNGDVSTGEADITFKAGESIILKDGFIAGNNFKAIIAQDACTVCNKCCQTNGVTYDLIPNVFTPNNDGIYDVWYIPDNSRPFCAFNAKGFDLTIKNRWGRTVYRLINNSGKCCCLQSPGPGNPIAKSSIFWDGKNNNGKNVSDGDYKYILILYTCVNNVKLSGSISVSR